MKKLQNTLYVTSPDGYLALDGENVLVRNEKEIIGRVPLHNLENIVSFGYRGASPALMFACAEKGIGLCFLSNHGRFFARIQGAVQGNVLLRTTQYRIAGSREASLELSKMFLLGKVYNARWMLEHYRRDHAMRIDQQMAEGVIAVMKETLKHIPAANSAEELRGLEGNAAKAYFSAFPHLILRNKEDFPFVGRNRRPPLDPVNAMLSFAYTLLGNEIASALETVGLDPAVGFMHTLRPGRASLAQDMLEELRAPLADRFVLSQINLGSVTRKDFETKENGAVQLTEDARRSFLTAWQKRKQETLMHPYLKEKVPWGLVPYTQAMLLARYLRGDMDGYPPFLWK